MTDLDKMIREALAEDDAKLLDEVGGELSLIQQVLDLFRSSSALLMVGLVIVKFAFLGLGVYSASSFFQATETKDLIMWGVLFMFAMQAVSMLKLWAAMEMNRVSVTREIKRLELQVAYMSRRLTEPDVA